MKTARAENEALKAGLAVTPSGMRAEMAQRDAALSERIATATELMASSRRWQTAITIAALIAFAPVLHRIANRP